MQVAVIGGGLAGLAAAMSIQEGGHQVTLLERRGILGGRASSYRDAVSGEDVGSGAHVLLGSYAATRELLRRAGVADALVGQEDLRIDAETAREFSAFACPRLGPSLSPGDPRLLFLRGGFGELFARLGREFASGGGLIRRRALAEAVEMDGGRVRSVRYLQRPEGRENIRSGKEATPERVAADAVVLAVPWPAVPPLVPEDLRSSPPFAGPVGLQSAPTLSIEMWVDRVVVDPILLRLRDPDAEFVIDKGRLHGREGPPQHLVLVPGRMSRIKPLSNAKQVAAAESALRRRLPAMAGAQVTRALVLREPEGRFIEDREGEGQRPGPATAVRGLFLAGDWTDNGFPDTIEGAVRSGLSAAASLESGLISG